MKIKKRNDEYLFEYESKIILFLVLFAGVIVILYSLGDTIKEFLPFALLFLAVIFLFVIGSGSNLKVEDYFQNETPDKLLNYYSRIYTVIRIPDHDAVLVYIKCLVYCYYGYFEEAQKLLSSVKWGNRVPCIQAFEYSIKALINYIKPEDIKEGLRLSTLAKNYSKISYTAFAKYSDDIPMSKIVNESYEVYIEIGELLNGDISEKIINSLENKFAHSEFYIKVLIAWCLAKVYYNLNQKEKSDEKLKYCLKAAPYCKPLHNIR